MSYGGDVGRIMRSGLRHWPKATLVGLVTALDGDEGTVTIAKLCTMLDSSENTVRGAIADLTSAGIVTVTVRMGAPSVYGVALDRLPEANPLTRRTPSRGEPLHGLKGTPSGGEGDPLTSCTPPLQEMRGSTSNRIPDARARSCPSSDLSLTSVAGAGGEGQEQHWDDEPACDVPTDRDYYSARGGNRPSQAPTPHIPPVEEGTDEKPASPEDALRRLEALALSCLPPGRRRGSLMLADLERRELLALGQRHGYAQVRAVLLTCAGADMPIAMLKKRLANAPTLAELRAREASPPPNRYQPPHDPVIDPEDMARGTKLLNDYLAALDAGDMERAAAVVAAAPRRASEAGAA